MRPIPVLGALSLLALLGCQTDPDALDPLPPGTSRVETSLTGTGSGTPPGRGNGGLTEVVVTVAKVTAHSNVAGWVTLSEREVTVDLLRLGAYSQPLGLRALPAGKVTQVRLVLKAEGPHYVVTKEGQHVALATPSGAQSGVKLKGLVDVDPCHLAALPIVFQGRKSIWVHKLGNQTRYTLRPVIHVGKVESTLVGCTPGGRGLPGAAPLPGEPQNPTISTTERPTPLTETPGNTVPLGPGLNCGSGLACLSGTCVDGTCTPSGAGAPCNFGGDCASGLCLPDATCGDGTARPSGSACLSDLQCLSNGCVGGRCTPGSTGARCQAEADCVVGTECISGTCEPMLN